MSPIPPVLPQQRRENPEPSERSRPVPWGLLMLVALMTAFGVSYIAVSDLDLPSSLGDGRTLAELRGNAPAAAGAGIDAAAIYATRCVACHQASGAGLPGVFPPLAGSEWVTGPERVLVALVLHGVSGTLTVKGTSYNGVMPTFKEQLSDAEIAALLTHLRTQWGNAAPAVTSEAVAKVRADTAGRKAPFAGDAELKAFQ
jgi:mono/diheme cytochrome c family protein